MEGQEYSRIQLWERNLLDLSLRNVLLNFRGNKNAIQLMMPELEMLEDALESRDELSLTAIPEDWTCTQDESRIFTVFQDAEAVKSFAEQKLKQKKLSTYYSDEQLMRALSSLYRDSKSSLEENGANTLYVAFGFLQWYEEKDKSHEKPRYAPILLYPVDMLHRLRDRSYVIRLRDEEPQINITLLEMLRQDFGLDVSRLLQELPQGEIGIDLQVVFTALQEAVAGISHFSVVERAFLGLFSFRQFMMWKDLRQRKEALMDHKVIQSLLQGSRVADWKPESDILDGKNFDQAELEQENVVPLSADASQMAAIYGAAKGESFVLHGPPGTGKSQTITNMIANALYQGKTVLFVADKMAALSVVQSRLEKIGLAPFCLELHSNKARKRDVLEQLSRTLELGHIAPPGGYGAKLLRLRQLKEELNQVTYELHEKRLCGKSLYELIGIYEQYLPRKNGEVMITDLLLGKTTEENFDRYQDCLQNCVVAAKECGSVVSHLFRLFQSREYTAMLRDTISALLKQFVTILGPLEDQYLEFCRLLSVERIGSYPSLQHIRALTVRLSETQGISANLIKHSGLAGLEGVLMDLLEQGNALAQERTLLLERFSPEILDYDYKKAVERLEKAEETFILFRNSKIQKLLDEINKMLRTADEGALTKDDLPPLFVQLKRYHDLCEYIQLANPNVTSDLFAEAWKGTETDFPALLTMYKEAVEIRGIISHMSLTAAEREQTVQAVIGILSDLPNYREHYGQAVLDYQTALQEMVDAEEQLHMNYGIRMENFRYETDWFQAVRTQIMLWRDHISELREWVGFLNAYDAAADMGLADAVQSMIEGSVAPDDLVATFYCQLTYGLVMRILGNVPALSRFQGIQFETSIAAFQAIDQELQQLTVQEIAAVLSEKLPLASASEAASSEVGILKKAIRSGGRRLSIRRLFEQIPNLLQRLCPCMLMSPLSVAQYIGQDFPKFDLVIFDEASQLPTCEAVGAIARGENVVVVGDPKQLPPTKFFQAQQEEEDFESIMLESLLDDCMAISMPQSHLLWHYRSRHESLIAYSNQKYYDNKLYTFPSPDEQQTQVYYVPVKGYYDRGKTRKNVVEAQAVTDEILRRLGREELRQESIGVVTFSLIQQRLIEDMLEDALAKQPEYIEYMEQLPEPIFVKNLENVQGDERDVILFSVGYGPDEKGNISMNFGPLNAEGGWRRLNVAITRARKQMVVFSSFRPEQLDLSKTESEGLIGLKGFLEFAAYGNSRENAMKGDVSSTGPARSARNFVTEQWIVSLLETLTFPVGDELLPLQLHTDIGVSDFRIDIGVVHPKQSKKYILGILCDGEISANAETARDRYLLQEDILKGLGWHLYRIWILDWLDNPKKELQKLRTVLMQRLQEIEDEPISEAELEIHLPAYAENILLETDNEKPEYEDTLVTVPEQKQHTADGTVSEEPVSEETNFPLSEEKQDTKEEKDILSTFARIPEEQEKRRRRYKETVFSQTYDQELFYQQKAAPLLRKMLLQVIETEAPISKRLLMKRVFQPFHVQKAGARVISVLEELLVQIPCVRQESFGQEFIWQKDQIPEQYLEYRIYEDAEKRRNMEDITLQELSNAIYDLLKQHIGMTQIDIIRELAKMFGYNRTGELMDAQISAAIQLSIDRGFACISPDGLRVQLSDGA